MGTPMTVADTAAHGSQGLDAYRQIIDSVPGLVLRYDAAGRVTFVSAGGGDLVGVTGADLLGSILRDAFHPDDGSAIDAAARTPGSSGVVIARMRAAEDRWIAVEATVRSLPSTGDRVMTIREAPDDGHAYASLRMGRDHYRALVDTLPQLVWMERADTGETVYVNQAFEACCGAIPPTREARTDRFHPADTGPIAAAYERALAQDRSCEVQARVRDRSGAYRWHQLVLRPLLKGSQLIGWLGSALDIDEIVSARETLEETGELLRLAQAAAGAGLFDIDLATRHVILSPESADLHGLPADRPAVLGLIDWMRRLAPTDRAQTVRTVREATAGRRTFDVAFRVPIADGAPRWIQAIGRPVHDRTGVAMRVVGLTLDITARKDRERALVEAKAAADAARAEAERANAAKTDFLSAMSHEIRTPLNAVIGFVGLLAESDRLDGELRRYAELARAAGQNLRTVVDDILDFSALEAGAVSLHPEPFAVRALVDGCLGIVGASAAAKGLEMTALIDSEIPAGLVGDLGRLRQILLNFLNNAVKFTQAGSVTVNLLHEGRTPWGERVRFSIIDTGIGIAPPLQARLFRRFSQADSSIRRDYGGTGLGLAISRHLVERMGGTIGVTSQAEMGATFWFTLTLPRAAVAPTAKAPAQATLARLGKILLVEDVEINRDLACIVLRNAGHSVDVAGDGIEAVRAVEANAYDLVLMDVQMPRLDGMMATRLIRCLPGPSAKVPVIAMTANVLPDQLAAFREAGMDAHFGKPFQPHELRTAVEGWLTAGGVEAVEGTGDLDGNDLREAAIDRDRYEDNLATLGGETLIRLLGHFHTRIRTAFPEPGGTPTERETLRAEAHALAAAAGLLGFMPLSRACSALERVGGDVEFDALLNRARDLAAEAAESTRALLADGLSRTGAVAHRR